MALGSPYLDEPLRSLPKWMRSVYATILRRDTPVQVCTSAAGRHQRSQENSNPSTTATWAQYFCTTLGKMNEDFVNGVDMDILIKVLFDSGIPMEKLLADTGRIKRGKKGKKSATEETPDLPAVERTQKNLTKPEVCQPACVHVVVIPYSLSRVRDPWPKVGAPPAPPLPAYHLPAVERDAEELGGPDVLVCASEGLCVRRFYGHRERPEKTWSRGD